MDRSAAVNEDTVGNGVTQLLFYVLSAVGKAGGVSSCLYIVTVRLNGPRSNVVLMP